MGFILDGFPRTVTQVRGPGIKRFNLCGALSVQWGACQCVTSVIALGSCQQPGSNFITYRRRLAIWKHTSVIWSSHKLRWVDIPAMCQAEKLDELLKKRGIGIDRVLNFDVPDSTLVTTCNFFRSY